MQAISDFCERLKAFFTKKPRFILPIIDESKIVDENIDVECQVPPTPTDLLSSLKVNPLSLPAQMPKAPGLLAQQRLVCRAMDTDIQHLGEDKNEGKQDELLD